MNIAKIVIAVGALVSFATAASADVHYIGSPKFGQFYTQDSVRNARAEVLQNDATVQATVPATPFRKGGISARGI